MFTSLAAVFVIAYHGIPKVLNPGNTMQAFESMGFPGFLGPLVGWVEVLAAIWILIGYKAKPALAAMIVIIATALFVVQLPNGVTAGFERDLLLLSVLLALFFTNNHSK